MNNRDAKNLKRRYLIWLYKTTKETLDKIERKFTQLEIDKFMFEELKRLNKDSRLQKFLDEFRTYIENKEKQGCALKYEGKDLSTSAGSQPWRGKPYYNFLVLKLKVIEKTIIKELGSAALKEIKFLYEKEMTERILKSTEHK